MSQQNFSLAKKTGGFLDQLSIKKRAAMIKLFLDEFPPDSFAKVLDVGVTADNKDFSSNYFEKYFSPKDKIIAFSDQDIFFLEQEYPGIKCIRGDVKKIPLADSEVDIVFSSAVIEHVGSVDNQKQMIAECFRVAKQGVYITTPNRWHPVDVHTLLPLIHFFPKKIHRWILRKIGYKFFSQEENLNLIDKKTFHFICQELGIKNYSIKTIKTGGFSSNLILIIKKQNG